MKPVRLLVIAGCFVIICAMFSGLVSGLSQEEAVATVFWNPSAPPPGSTAIATVFFINKSNDTLAIERVGLHFDWMDSGFFGITLSDPVTVPSQGTYNFNPMLISIPANVESGTHTYYVGIGGVQGSTEFFWTSAEISMTIGTGNSSQETYTTLKTQIFTKLSSANYKSPEAISLKNQAQTKYTQAVKLAEEDENWAAAISALQSASSLLAQADTAEQNYKPTFWDQYLLIIIVGVVAAVVAILLVLFMIRRRRKQPQPEPAAPTPPPPAEQPSYEI
ncbi:MAG: hypothetical protein NWE99_04250 [Candidatus Bathyarchaeota archaeon]|nr:hypothetical protein [Candidatus Bathyarchaeota archaeon]